jgi:hypothetical protein
MEADIMSFCFRGTVLRLSSAAPGKIRNIFQFFQVSDANCVAAAHGES